MAEVNRTYVHFPGTSRVPAGRKNMLSVFCDIYWIGTKLYLSSAISSFHLFHFQDGLLYNVCVRMCGSECTCPRACCVFLHSISTLWSRFRHQLILHLSVSLQRHLNFLPTSLTTVPWRTDTSFLSVFDLRLSLSLLSCSHHFASVSFQRRHLSAAQWRFIISALLEVNQMSGGKSCKSHSDN